MLPCLQNTVLLYKVSDATGSLKVDKLPQKPLSQGELSTNVCDPFSLLSYNIVVFSPLEI